MHSHLFFVKLVGGDISSRDKIFEEYSSHHVHQSWTIINPNHILLVSNFIVRFVPVV